KAPAKPAAAAARIVVYDGFEFTAPASWPVYRLDEHPQTCVRYDVHAIYLGTPGADMRCAAGLIGRTQTVSFIPSQPAATGAAAGRAGRPDGGGGTAIQRLPALDTTITQDTVAHELQVALGPASVTGTYGTDSASVKQILDSLRAAPSGAASTAQSAPAQSSKPASSREKSLFTGPAPATPGQAKSRSKSKSESKAKSKPKSTSKAKPKKAAPAKPAPSATSSSWQGVPAHWPIQIIQPTPPPPPQPVATVPVSGFDTCAAPSLATMKAWRAAYAAAGVYIGGVNTGCAQANLSASWTQSVGGLGYGMLPVYVGPQAPCWDHRGVLVNPATAVADGKAAGTNAVNRARAYGLSTGSPIYYDMEAYVGSAGCTTAVLTFLGAWDQQVNASGYLSGVYSSELSGIRDLQAATAGRMAGFTPPNAIWIAQWDNVASLIDGTLAWPLTDRSKQYGGPANVTVGGITLNIDRDFVGGPVAR
ncbi:MAG TPA: DUF1906 domain-containing protein, partial [Trebonia sp.]